MARTKVWVLGIVGLLLPVALALAPLVIATRVDATVNPPVDTVKVNQQLNSGTGDRDGKEVRGGTPSPSAGATPSVDDHGNKCSEPEHVNDPSCQSPSPTPT